MYGKGSNKAGLNPGETSWRSYSKNLIIELKEKLADRRARTLTVLSESGDVTAFNEIDTESDGLEDTSNNTTNHEDSPTKNVAMQHGQVAEGNSLSDSSSLAGSDYNDPDIRHDGPKRSPGASDCVHSRCCSRSCSGITSVSGRSYTSEDVSSRSLDDFVADDIAPVGSKERNHQCPHSVDVRCSLCLIERTIQERYFSTEAATEVSQRRKTAHQPKKLSKYFCCSTEMVQPLFGSGQKNTKVKSDTYLCGPLEPVDPPLDSHTSTAGVLIVSTLAGLYYPATDSPMKISRNNLALLPHLELGNRYTGSDQVFDHAQTGSHYPKKTNTDSLHDCYLQVEDGEDDFLEDVFSDEEEEVEDEERVVSEKHNVEVVGDVEEESVLNKEEEENTSSKKDKIEAESDKDEEEVESIEDSMGVISEDNDVSERDTEEEAEVNKEEIFDLTIEKIELDNGDNLKERGELMLLQAERQLAYKDVCEEQHKGDEIYEEQHIGDEIYEEQQLTEVEEESEINHLIDNCTFILDVDGTQETDPSSDNILDGSLTTTVKQDQTLLNNGFNSLVSEPGIKQDTLTDEPFTSLGIQQTDHRSFSYMKTMLNELVRIFESNAEFYNAVNKTIVDRFENHYADFNMLFSAYENKSGNSGYIQVGKSASGAPDPPTEGSGSGTAHDAAKLNDQNRSLQVCLEKARLANTLQAKVGHMRSMATNVAAIKAYEQTIADLEKTMMDYLQIYAKEARDSVSDNLDKLPQTSSKPSDAVGDSTSNILPRSGTFVLKETCAAKPPNTARRRDSTVTAAAASLPTHEAFVTEAEENVGRNEDFQNGPHPSPTFLVSDDSKVISENFTEMPNHSLTKGSQHDMGRNIKKSQRTVKGPSCLVSDQDFDSDSSESLCEAKETRNLTYTSSLLAQLLDYNSADESKPFREKANSKSTCSKPSDSSCGLLKQQRSAKSKNATNVKVNNDSKKPVKSNVLIKSQWMSLNDDDDGSKSFIELKPNFKKDTTNVDTTCDHILSESFNDDFENNTLPGSENELQPKAISETTRASRKQDLADIKVLSRVTNTTHLNAGAIPKVVAGSSRHEVIIPSTPTGSDRRVNKQITSLLEKCLDEEVTNPTASSTENETVVAERQPAGRSPSRYFLGQQAHKQWKLHGEDTEDVPASRKQDMLLPKLDWSSSDDEVVDDVPRDVSPSILLRQKQKRDVADQLEHLNQFYSRSRKSRSPLRRAATSNISRWINEVQGASTERMPGEERDVLVDSFPVQLRHKYDVLSGHTGSDTVASKYYDINEDSDNNVFVSPSQLLEARNEGEKDDIEEKEFSKQLNEMTGGTDKVLRSATFKEDQTETLSHEGSKRSWSVSSTSDEYILSDTRSIQVNMSRDNLICVAPEDVDMKQDRTNTELAQTPSNKLFTDSCVQGSAPKFGLAVSGSSSFTVLSKQSNTRILEEGFNGHQAAPAIGINNESTDTVTAASTFIDNGHSPDERPVAECPRLTDLVVTETNITDSPCQCSRSVSSGQTPREDAAHNSVCAKHTGNGTFHELSQVETICTGQDTDHTSHTPTLRKVINKGSRNNDSSYCDTKVGESCREQKTDISSIRERWKFLEESRNADTCIESERKHKSTKNTQKYADVSALSSISHKTHRENLISNSSGKNNVQVEQAKDVKITLPVTSSPYNLTDMDEQFKSRVGDSLTEYQAIDALRYKVNRLEQMLQQSDINTANLHQRNTSIHAEEPLQTSEKKASCPHCPVSAAAYSLTHSPFQPPLEYSHGALPCCLAYTDRHYLQRGLSVGQIHLNGHGSCVDRQGGSHSVDTQLFKQYTNKSSKECQTSGDLTQGMLKPAAEVTTDGCTQCDTPADECQLCLISLEKQVATVHEDMQEIKQFATGAKTLMMELEERLNNIAAFTSSTLATHSRQLEDSQAVIAAKLNHIQDSLGDQSDMVRLVREYVSMAEKNSETVLETVRAEHQTTIAKTAQTVEEAILQLGESFLIQQKDFETVKSNLDTVVSRLNDKRPEPSKKGMNHESMKERIVELTSQRDAEKVFHRITRQALRALEKDHDRLRQEYVRATCRRYNTNESEAQKRLWYYLNNEDKCPHNKNHSNRRTTRQHHEVPLPRDSSTDGDCSSSCSRQGSCPYAHICQTECLRLPHCGCVVSGDRRQPESNSRRKDNIAGYKNTDIIKCASKVGTCLALSVESHRNEDGSHNLAAVHVVRSPRKSRDRNMDVESRD